MSAEFWKFLKQEDKREHETKYVVWVRIVKNILQYLIGLGIFILVTFELGVEVFASDYQGVGFLKTYIDQPILKMVSIALAAATAVELAYMLFTPGPDEAVQPVMMGVASAVLFLLSKDNLDGLKLIGIALLICTIPLLFWLNYKMKEWQEQERIRNDK